MLPQFNRWILVRVTITALSFLSVTVALGATPEQAYYAWYLYYSPVIIAALSFGLLGAVAASAWAAFSLGITFERIHELIGLYDVIGNVQALLNNAVIGMVLTTFVSCVIGWLVDETRRQAARYEEFAKTDGLTGLSNHRHLIERLDDEVARTNRLGRPCAYLMVDVDGLKAYNDTHGHPAGDLALQDVARLLKRNIRSIDCAGRYGGDEFGVVLVDTSEERAVGTAERLRTSVSAHFSTNGDKPVITVSIGVAACPLHGESSRLVIDAADQALYQTKLKGKDGVSLAATGS